MANYTITPADVVKATVDGISPVIVKLIAGGTITAGEGIAKNEADSLAYINDASDTDIDFFTGLALNSATAGQPIDIITGGYVTVSAVGTAGDVVVMSQTAGKIAPHDDLVATDEVAIFGYFISTSVIKVAINNLGIAKG